MSYSNPEAYERFMGRWSARLAPSFLRFVDVQPGQHVLDVGCGTGSLSGALVDAAQSLEVTGIDPVPDYVSFARDTVSDRNARFEVGTVEALPFAPGMFDATLALLVLQDLDEPERAIHEMLRVTKARGLVATCLWDFEQGMPMFSLLWRAAEAVSPEAVARQRQANPGPARASLDHLRTLWVSCGLEHVTVATLELSMEFASFDDYWQPFLGGATPTSAFAATLDADTGGALVNQLRASLPNVNADGSLVLSARAWAIKGVVPDR